MDSFSETRRAEFGVGPDDVAAGPLEGLHLLVADDCVNARRLLTYVLRRAGAGVTAVADGYAAVERIAAGAGSAPISAVLCDYDMPGIDGIETTRRLRGAGFDGPLVAMSGIATAEQLWAWLEAGCDGFFKKPFSAAEVLDAVGRGLEAAAERTRRTAVSA